MGKKFVNPVERARKQAKQKELKKNKKQRIEARNLNLKGKDPNLIILELERLDQIQYSIDETPKLNEKVIENKRNKLRQTFFKVLGIYKQEDQQKYNQVKRLEMEYEAKRVQLIKKYEAINSAKQVNLEEIPLPFCPEDSNSTSTKSGCSKLNTEIILSKYNLREPQSEFLTIEGEKRTDLKPPGCPALCPPSIEELEEDIKTKELEKNAEKDLDEFLKEVDQVEKMVSSNTKKIFNEPQSTLSNLSTSNNAVLSVNSQSSKIQPPIPIMVNHMPFIPNSTPNPINPAPFPVLLNPMGLLNQPVKKLNTSIRPPIPNLNKSTATLHKSYHHQQTKKEPVSATIEAKPQLRNLSADVTKFLPTSLRIKRPETSVTKKVTKPNERIRSFKQSTVTNTNNRPVTNQANKDAAYDEFMKELNGLL